MLTEARKGEIALMIVKMRLRVDGVRLGKNTRRDVGNTAKELDIPFEEAIELMEGLTQELMAETFANKKDDTGTK
jgi:hypothetical protein